MKLLYLATDTLVIIVPLLFSFHPLIKFYQHWKAFFLANGTVAAIFILWDMVFAKLNVWNFNPQYTTGLYIFNLPIEEVLFFVCIPFSCVFTFYCLEKFSTARRAPQTEVIFCILLAAMLMLIGALYAGRLYTFTAFESAAAVLLCLKFVFRVNWISRFLLAYCVLLLPFLVVNGILTGTGLKAPVVAYSSADIIGFRVLSIPIEDFVYSFELQLLNVFAFKKALKAGAALNACAG